MKSTKHIAAFAAVAAFAVAGVTATAVARDDGKLKSDVMIGVPSSMTGPTHDIRGVIGGGLPWAIGESEVSVKSSGKIEAEFQDLVLAAGANSGKNPVGLMAVTVSCLNESNQTENVTSPSFAVTTATPTDPGGDADVETKVNLPSPCFAPIVFIVNAGTGAWFAVDGL